MGNYDEIDQKTAKELLGVGIESSDELLLIANELLEKGLRFEAFLISARGFRIYQTEDFRSIVEETAGCKVQEEFISYLRDYSEGLFFEKFEDPESLSYEYEVLISYYMLRSSWDSMWFLFLTLDQNKSNHDTDFIKRIVDVHSSYKGWPKSLWQLFHRISKESKKDETITFFAEQLISFKQRNLLSTFYWYYSYLGESRIASIIFESLIKDSPDTVLHLSFDDNFVWPDFPLENVKEKCKSLRKNGHFKKSLNKLALSTLVPLALYFKELGDVEGECFVLSYLIEKSPSEKLAQRIHEIAWVQSAIQDCQRILDFIGVPDTGLIVGCKKIFSVNPLSTEVLKALLKINACVKDSEINSMLHDSVEKINSKKTLSTLLLFAIAVKSRYGFNLILIKIIHLSYFSVIIDSLDRISDFFKEEDSELIKLTMESLQKYVNSVPAENIDRSSYDAFIVKYVEFIPIKKTSGKQQRKDRDQEKVVLKLFHHKQHVRLMIFLKERKITSLVVLETILKSAIITKIGPNIMLAYQRLAEVNKDCAASYSSEVAPYFAVDKKDKKQQYSNEGNLTSGIWGSPAILENPIDSKALRVSGQFRKPSTNN